jgi:hypothetical protein
MSRRMMGLDGVRLRRGGWSFLIPGYDARFSEELRESLLDSAFAAIDGTLARRVRRSRHAETWFKHFDHGLDAYFKVLDPIGRLNRAKGVFRRRRVAHVASISEHLRADGIGVPEILLLGTELRGGREIIVTSRVDGFNVVRHFKHATLASRRVMLRALGAEIARLHRAGYLHGDLTPYNIYVTGLEPPQFVFIDHERTRHTILSRFERPRMRNLVQLGHLEVDGVTNTDRMRVWSGYSAQLSVHRRQQERRRVTVMLQARIADERGDAAVAALRSSSLGRHSEASGS